MDNGVIQSIAGIESQILLTRKHIAHGTSKTALAVSICAPPNRSIGQLAANLCIHWLGIARNSH